MSGIATWLMVHLQQAGQSTGTTLMAELWTRSGDNTTALDVDTEDPYAVNAVAARLQPP